MDPLRHLRFSLILLLAVMTIGTGGYVALEGWSWFDALYMTVITLATVGFREVHILSPHGMAFTIVLIIFGTGILAYVIGSVAQFMVEGHLRRVLGRRKVEKQIDKLANHYIICGFGRIGAIICRELAAKPLSFVVVEKHAHLCEKIDLEGYLYIHGDATDDDVLLKAGVARAKGLITVVTADADNVYITLTARGLKQDLFILARASEEGAEKKLLRAGASKVISPYTIGGTRMAQAILRPSVMDFIEIATAGQNLELQLEEICLRAGSPLIAATLVSSGIRKELGLIIVGILKPDGQMVFNPVPDTRLAEGDTLIALGQQAAIVNLERLAG